MSRSPTYDELLRLAEPAGSAWDVYGRGDRLGSINLLTAERVAAASRLVRTGRRFGLDHAINAFDPYPTGTRPPAVHHVFANNEFHRDDWVDSLYLQSTSQLDALRHIGSPEHGFYGGLPASENTPESTALGIDAWAEHGIAGRGVLLDLAGWHARTGRHWHPEEPIAVGPDLLDAVAADQGVDFAGGDLLLLRTGWAETYLEKDREARLAVRGVRSSPGLAQRHEVLRWLWDREIALVAADNLAVEVDPVQGGELRGSSDRPPERGVDHSGMLHRPLIALLGMAVGELWRLDELAADCAADGVYESFVTAKPLRLVGGVGSPPNAIAFK